MFLDALVGFFSSTAKRKKGLKKIFKCVFWCAPFGYLYFFFSVSEPGLGVEGTHPGMDLTPFPCQDGRDSNPQPFGCEPTSLTTTPSSHSLKKIFTSFLRFEARNRYVTSFLVQF